MRAVGALWFALGLIHQVKPLVETVLVPIDPTLNDFAVFKRIDQDTRPVELFIGPRLLVRFRDRQINRHFRNRAALTTQPAFIFQQSSNPL